MAALVGLRINMNIVSVAGVLIGTGGYWIEEDGACHSHQCALRRINTTVLLCLHVGNPMFQSWCVCSCRGRRWFEMDKIMLEILVMLGAGPMLPKASHDGETGMRDVLTCLSKGYLLMAANSKQKQTGLNRSDPYWCAHIFACDWRGTL